MEKYKKELVYIDKQLKKAKIHLKTATKQNDILGVKNLKNTIEVLENIKAALDGDKVIENCPKCGSPLRVVVDQDAKVMVELVQRTSATTMKSNKTAVAP